MLFKKYFFFIQHFIFYQQYNFVVTLNGNIRQAEENEFPSVVSISRLADPTGPRIEVYHKCTGTLVSRQDVLSAEHCVRGTLRVGFKVLLGSYDLHSATEFFPLFVWTYEHWTVFRRRHLDFFEHDIAIIKLLGNVPETIQFSPNGNIQSDMLYGMDVVTAGWGRLQNDTIPRYLHTGTMQVMTKSDCDSRYRMLAGYEISMDERRICTIADPFVNLNEGDSGGPLFFIGNLIAVNSGVCPDQDGPVRPYQINVHLSLRSYQEYFQDIITTFHSNF